MVDICIASLITSKVNSSKMILCLLSLLFLATAQSMVRQNCARSMVMKVVLSWMSAWVMVSMATSSTPAWKHSPTILYRARRCGTNDSS